MMRIWHQSLTVLGDVPGYQNALERHLAKIAGEDMEVVMHGLAPDTYSTDFPLAELYYPALASYHFNQILSNAIRAEEGGFDAYAMCFLAGPNLREMRSAVDIPVVNYGEAAYHFASFYGKKFGIVRFTENMREFSQEFVDAWGFHDKCAGISACGLSTKEVFSSFEAGGAAIAKFSEHARAFVKATGADVIVPGEMPLNVLLAVNGVTRIDDVPIIDGCAVTLLLARMMVELRGRFGMSHSRHGRANAQPPRERLLEVARRYGLDRPKD